MGVSIVLAFGYVFYLGDGALSLVLSRASSCSGFGGANFALYTLWLPEQYTTDCRASAIAFISSVGRFVGVAMVFLVGSGFARTAAWGFRWRSRRSRSSSD